MDSIGIAGFGHDFGSLDGKYPAVVEAFDIIGSSNPGAISQFVFFLGPVLPMLLNLPTSRNRLFSRLHNSMVAIANELLVRTRKEKEGAAEEKSLIGLLSMFFERLRLYSM